MRLPSGAVLVPAPGGGNDLAASGTNGRMGTVMWWA